MTIKQKLNALPLKRKALVLLLGGGLALAPTLALADLSNDILGKILNQVTQILQQQYQQFAAMIQQMDVMRQQGEAMRDKMGQESDKNRQQQCDIWCGKSLPKPGEVPADANNTGSPGAAMSARRGMTAQLQAVTGNMAGNMDQNTAIQGYYGALANWFQSATPQQKQQVQQPLSFAPGDVPSAEDRKLADYNAKLTIGLEPVPPVSSAQIKSNPAAQEYEARRIGYNSAQLVAYDSYRQYDLSAEEVKTVSDVLLSMSQQTIENMNPGTAMKAQVQLLAVQSGLLLSQYQSSLRQERLLAVMAANNARMSMSDRLRRLSQSQAVQSYAK
ncbi:hypothetical protein KIF53_17475 [Chromobacterium subtsugae]|uniref:Uncharacterized protein n=1 Tax=Chromobacterium subtsugae TaxID=251747 RepID=A0ABS7FH65_9NEIS|nr:MULTISPECIES: hypothetical protein [Chromobacterium]KUM04279.1 hypothetical protein Cv017_00550 [Chromobacterium subtsugae]KZE88357.1 hypothetical protein AWB61_00300 [Chromobacterium sp. F49]MBW7568742.1 hypothetical protein [Chromobacterium subtsugae]MBW8289428.1 hypothetical protein [Chromobacterium subtsugae]WSE90030.1 hypothetical protein U6115_14155 [Chromobacterium subtsugae]